jgi:hypothetical protein
VRGGRRGGSCVHLFIFTETLPKPPWNDQGMGFSTTDKVFSPERIPQAEGLLPSIQRSPDMAAYSNAKNNQRKKDTLSMLSKTAATLPESMPGEAGQGREDQEQGGPKEGRGRERKEKGEGREGVGAAQPWSDTEPFTSSSSFCCPRSALWRRHGR